MTRTPVAIGSRVPACPTRRVPASRRIRATTSWEVRPAGLSTMNSPEDGVPVVTPVVFVVPVVAFGGLAVRVGVAGPLGALASTGELGVGALGRRHQAIKAGGAVGRGFGDERHRRRVPQAELPANLGADDPGRAVQRGRGLLPLL